MSTLAALTDAALTDAALTDAALTDAALTDAALTDAALTDAALTDASADALANAMEISIATMAAEIRDAAKGDVANKDLVDAAINKRNSGIDAIGRVTIAACDENLYDAVRDRVKETLGEHESFAKVAGPQMSKTRQAWHAVSRPMEISIGKKTKVTVSRDNFLTCYEGRLSSLVTAINKAMKERSEKNANIVEKRSAAIEAYIAATPDMMGHDVGSVFAEYDFAAIAVMEESGKEIRNRQILAAQAAAQAADDQNMIATLIHAMNERPDNFSREDLARLSNVIEGLAA